MSLEQIQKISCPKCGKEGEFTAWSSINTELNPEMKSRVRDLSAFKYTCPDCGASFTLDYDFVYHQIEDKYMVECCVSSMSYEKAKAMAEINPLLPPGYVYRVVPGHNRFLEKLKIFDLGYDDRVIELVKAIYRRQMAADPQCAELGDMLFDRQNGDDIIVLFRKDGSLIGAIHLDAVLYEAVSAETGKNLPPIHEHAIRVVDSDWAEGELGE